MGHACTHIWPYMGAAMGHACAHTWATWKQQWGMHARIYGPYMGAYMGHMGAAMGHTCAHTWATWKQQWGMHARIHKPYGSSNGACMRVYIGHIWGQQYSIHTRIHGHIWGSPIGRAGRKGTTGNPFPSLDQGRELPRAYPYLIPQRSLYIVNSFSIIL